jgi:hypothetical protein
MKRYAGVKLCHWATRSSSSLLLRAFDLSGLRMIWLGQSFVLEIRWHIRRVPQAPVSDAPEIGILRESRVGNRFAVDEGFEADAHEHRLVHQVADSPVAPLRVGLGSSDAASASRTNVGYRLSVSALPSIGTSAWTVSRSGLRPQSVTADVLLGSAARGLHVSTSGRRSPSLCAGSGTFCTATRRSRFDRMAIDLKP